MNHKVINMETTIKFNKSVSSSLLGETRESANIEKIESILDNINDRQITSITFNEKGELIWVLNSSIEDEKGKILVLEKLSKISDIEAFSIEFREPQVNLMELLIPYLPQIISKLVCVQ